MGEIRVVVGAGDIMPNNMKKTIIDPPKTRPTFFLDFSLNSDGFARPMMRARVDKKNNVRNRLLIR